MPDLTVLDVLTVFDILAAVVDSVLESEPGDMVLLQLQLYLKLSDPETFVRVHRSHIDRFTDRERFI